MLYEVITALVFLYVVGGMKQSMSESMVNTFGYLAAIAGIALIILIPAVYQLDTIPAWDTPFTSLQMVFTAIICGGAIMTAIT